MHMQQSHTTLNHPSQSFLGYFLTAHNNSVAAKLGITRHSLLELSYYFRSGYQNW